MAFIHFRPSIGIHRKALRLPRERLLLLSTPRKTAHRRNPLVETPIPKQSRRFGSFPLIPLSVVDTPYLLQHPVWPVEHLHSSETPNKRTQNHFAVRIEKVSFSKCCAVATGKTHSRSVLRERYRRTFDFGISNTRILVMPRNGRYGERGSVPNSRFKKYHSKLSCKRCD